MKWIKQPVKKNINTPVPEKLKLEFVEAAKKKGYNLNTGVIRAMKIAIKKWGEENGD